MAARLDAPWSPVTDGATAALPPRAAAYPELRYMGSKQRLLPWIHSVLAGLDFESAADPFAGSGCVAYLLKCMGRQVAAADFLNFAATLAGATVRNSQHQIDATGVKQLLAPVRHAPSFIESTFTGIFYTPAELRLLDRICYNIEQLPYQGQQDLARAALIRSCLKKQPRGVFTVAGKRYDDGRLDLRKSMEEHFHEQIAAFNQVVFDNGKRHTAERAEALEFAPGGIDLVYLDPPYVPRADDNCYIKRYHFLEGLSCYWRGLSLMPQSKVKKLQKRFTPFSYRRTALEAFERLFARWKRSTIVLSYSSNGYPDRDVLEALLRKYKPRVDIYERPHRYHFGTHEAVERAQVQEYLLVGR